MSEAAGKDLGSSSYRIECAWCHRHLGWKQKDISVPGETTYGICDSCAADLLSTWRQQRAKSSPSS